MRGARFWLVMLTIGVGLLFAWELAPAAVAAVKHIGKLFHTATHHFNRPEGKIAALLFIACFAVPAWAIRRFIDMRGWKDDEKDG